MSSQNAARFPHRAKLGTVNPFCPVCLIETKIEHTPTGYKIYVCQKCDRYWHPDEVPP